MSTCSSLHMRHAPPLGSDTSLCSYLDTILHFYTTRGLELLFDRHPALEEHMMGNYDVNFAIEVRCTSLYQCFTDSYPY